MSERYREPERRLYPDFEKDPGRIEREPLSNVESEREWDARCLLKQFRNHNCPSSCPFHQLALAKVMADNGRTDLKRWVDRKMEGFDPKECVNQRTMPPVR